MTQVINDETQHSVDRLLLEQGEYLPLEFLLREGRLIFEDYESWRNGETTYLEDALFGDSEQIRQTLHEAEVYLQHLGWRSEPLVYREWRGETPKPLRFSVDKTFDHCFHRRYKKPEDQPQLDLFSDTPSTYLLNLAVQSLIEGNVKESRRAVHQLYDTAPDQPHLGELEQLLEVVEQLDAPVADLEAEFLVLRDRLTPLADSLLGRESPALLIPLWQRIAAGLREVSFQQERAEFHLSYAAGRAMDWASVVHSVEGEENWQSKPVLLIRHAQACTHLHQQEAALESWFRLLWQYPEQGDALASSSDRELKHLWRDFNELSPELEYTDFPAWLILINPGFRHSAPHDEKALPCPDSYRTLYRLKATAAQGAMLDLDEESIALRAQLQRENATLFFHFMAAL
jgi:hypothetical protein